MPTHLPERKSAAQEREDRESDPVLLMGTVAALGLILCLSIVELSRLDPGAAPKGELADLTAGVGYGTGPADADGYAARHGGRPAFVSGVNIKPD
jgi:hypothetical protein